MQVVLVMFRADGARRSFPLSRDVTIIGRREDCDLRIPLTEVSRKHCRLIKEPEGLRIEDLGSSNGTFHNGTRIQESVIQPGDQIQIGPVGFTVQIDNVPPDEMILPPSQQQEQVAAEPNHDADSSSAGAQLDDSAVEQAAETQETELDEPSQPSRRARPSSPVARPVEPTDDVLGVASDEDEQEAAEDGDIIDMGVSPGDDNKKR